MSFNTEAESFTEVACLEGGFGRSEEPSFPRLAEGNLEGGVLPPLAGDLGIPDPDPGLEPALG